VVGTDGWNSSVARAVNAERHHEKPVLEHAFYSYWSGLPVDGMVTIIRGDRGIAAILTNDDLTRPRRLSVRAGRRLPPRPESEPGDGGLRARGEHPQGR
jgi:hypothetical protein